MQLNFDKFNFQIKNENNQTYIFDIVRKKYLVLTPEEWVRQHCVHQLVANGYASALMSIEKSLPNSKKRYDIIVYNRDGKPEILVECKAPSVKITESTLNQVTGYIALQEAPNILLSNGLQHFFIRRIDDQLEIVNDFPKN